MIQAGNSISTFEELWELLLQDEKAIFQAFLTFEDAVKLDLVKILQFKS